MSMSICGRCRALSLVVGIRVIEILTVIDECCGNDVCFMGVISALMLLLLLLQLLGLTTETTLLKYLFFSEVSQTQECIIATRACCTAQHNCLYAFPPLFYPRLSLVQLTNGA